MVFIHRKDEMSAILIKSQQQEILYQKVRSINSSLEKKVEARTQQLQHALEVKSRFLRNISHEIRIPLHGIINLSTIVNEQWSNLPELKKKELIEHLAKSSDRLMSLVSNLLDISVMTENKLKLYKSECDLIQLTQEVINEFKLTLENKNILLDLNNTEKMLCLCDKERISQVIRNLISNAIKYGNNTPITIALERKHNNTIQLAISDQGVGIPDNELEHIFKQFEESSRTRTSAGGTGLGLAICKEIITAHHGTIRATNNKTKGSTFIFDIPTDLITTQLPQQQKTVLIIDDEEVILTSTSLTLELLGYKVICAQRASEALLILDATIPDLILLDLMMPETNGGQLLHKLRYSKKFKHIPVIVQTGFSNAAELAGIKKLGISGLLKKPYGKKEIIKVLSKIF
jgi:two-component system sensor histidine kinase ChiS